MNSIRGFPKQVRSAFDKLAVTICIKCALSSIAFAYFITRGYINSNDFLTLAIAGFATDTFVDMVYPMVIDMQ
jgi:hypothetical protein